MSIYRRLSNLLSSLTRALLCDKNKDGTLTGNPSFAKFAFWLIVVRFLRKPETYGEYWFYTTLALLAYILFGTKFIPSFFATKTPSESQNNKEV